MHLFFAHIEGESAFLTEEESHHCTKVLRLREGDRIQVSDGGGDMHEGVLTEVHHKHCEARIDKSYPRAASKGYLVHMFCAPTKNNERFEWFLEKGAEIGMDRVTPLLTAHSERKTINRERMERVLLSAMKQCQSGYLTRLGELTALTSLWDQVQRGPCFIAYCGEEIEKKSLSECCADYFRGEGKGKEGEEVEVSVFIGPEGDFTPEEVRAAVAAGFVPVHLGGRRLRTETAGVCAVWEVVRGRGIPMGCLINETYR